ncbi:hypothetical protein Tco_1080973 [Tanacetum coccineum]|uniref:Uncharacterized protein n=1 Tax=Tanacetum coccineum TaxID=301880 RepID=A0ABQ5HWA1_9ASTR
MVAVTIHQDTSVIRLMSSPVIDLTTKPDSPKVHWPPSTTIMTTLPLPPQPQQGSSDSIIQHISELEKYMADLVEANQALEERLDKQGTRLYNLENLDIPHQVSKAVDGIVTDAVNWALQAPLRDRFRDLPEADMKEILCHRMWESNSCQAHEDHKKLYEFLKNSIWMMIRLQTNRHTRLKPLTEDRPATPEPAWSIPSSDLTVPINNWAFALKYTYAPPLENSLLTQTGDMAAFMDWHNVSKPLPLGGLPGQVTIQSAFFFNKDLEYLRYGRKISRPALSISKMKVAYYPDVGLEQMVPDQMWIKEECKYDIAAMYGISHWWFQRQRFYIDKHTSEGDRRAVRTYMCILSVIQIEVFSLYGYDYMKQIVLCRADLKEYIITERDFKYLYPSDFEDLQLMDQKLGDQTMRRRLPTGD